MTSRTWTRPRRPAIGVAAGLGRESTAILSTLLALVVLTVIPRLAGYAFPAPPPGAPPEPPKATAPDRGKKRR